MMKWITAKPEDLLMTLLSASIVYACILLLTRVAGLRSFSKMSAADFAMTIAVGSLFAATISAPSPSLVLGLTSISALFFGQWLIAFLRRRSNAFAGSVDNVPLLLMAGSEFIDEHLDKAHVTRADIYGKLREANVRNFDEVIAVIFESTGDVSVLHAEGDVKFDPKILTGVAGADRLQASQS